MIFKRTALLSTVAAVGMTLGPVSTATAQQESQIVLDQITVTARKKSESLLEAPVSLSAFGAAAIEELGLQSIDDIARFTPGLSFSKAFGRSTERPVVRGQSNVLAGVQFGVESGTAYFIDGVYFPGSISNLDPNDLERVEVIKGPQSALYGRNTYAGAINFITKGGADELGGHIKVRGGEHDEYEVSASVGGPISDKASARFTARRYHYGGEWNNTVTDTTVGGESTWSVSGVVDYQPTENLSIRVRGMYTVDRDDTLALFLQPAAANNCEPGWRSNSAWLFNGDANNNQYFCGVIEPAPVALNTGADADGIANVVPGVADGSTFFGTVYHLIDGTAFDGIERKQKMFTTNIDYDIGGSGYTATLMAGYRDETYKFGADSDHSSVNFFFTPSFVPTTAEGFFANTTRDEDEDYSFEFRLASPVESRLFGMIGAYYYKQTNDNFDITFTDLTGENTFTDTTTTENKALFALVEFDVTEELSVTVEGRYAEEKKTDTSSPLGEENFYNFTPRVTVDYALPNGGTVYAIYAEGVKPGGLNGDDGAEVGIPTYEQETSDNFELGVKMPIAQRFTLQASGYYIDASNVQLTTALGTPTGALTSIATNQGSGEIKGLELDFSGQLTDRLGFGLTYSLTDSEFTDGCDPDEWTLTSGGGTLTDPENQTGTEFFGATGTCSIEGNRFPLSSKHQIGGFARYEHPLENEMTLFVDGNFSYESSKFVQVHNRAETGGAFILGARIGVQKDNWKFAIWGRNLTDEDSVTMATRWLQTPYLSSGFSLNIAPAGASTSAPRGFFGSLRRGRQVGAELSVDF